MSCRTLSNGPFELGLIGAYVAPDAFSSVEFSTMLLELADEKAGSLGVLVLTYPPSVPPPTSATSRSKKAAI